MKSKPQILHVLFPHVRAELLRILFFDPKRECYIRELARQSALSLGTIQQELATLSALGLVTSRSDGYHRFYRANRHHPLFGILQYLVIKGGGDRPFVNQRKRPRQSWRWPRRRPAPRPFKISMGYKTPK
jgi:DNA-binding transcriptional ArsR family regulator